jgi:hypothetical protein
MAHGERRTGPKRGWYMPVSIDALPEVPPAEVILESAERPAKVTAQPGSLPIENWKHENERLILRTPAFDTHCMVVVGY